MNFQVSPETLGELDASIDSFARNVNKSLKRYERELSPYLNSIHTWTFTPTSSLAEMMAMPFAKGDFKKVNRLYWEDLYESINATRNIFIKRSKPLVASSVALVNQDDLISSAAVARSLLELSIWALQHSATLMNTLRGYKAEADPNIHLMEATGLQELVAKLIWGTRLKDRVKRNKQLAQMHIIDEFKKVAARDKDKFIEQTYDFLCELCHPNAVGNWVFADADGAIDSNFRIDIPIQLLQIGSERQNALHHICGAIGWSAIAMSNSNFQFDRALIWIDSKFNLGRAIN